VVALEVLHIDVLMVDRGVAGCNMFSDSDGGLTFPLFQGGMDGLLMPLPVGFAAETLVAVSVDAAVRPDMAPVVFPELTMCSESFFTAGMRASYGLTLNTIPESSRTAAIGPNRRLARGSRGWR